MSVHHWMLVRDGWKSNGLVSVSFSIDVAHSYGYLGLLHSTQPNSMFLAFSYGSSFLG